MPHRLRLLYTLDYLRIIVTDPDMEKDPSREEDRRISMKLLLKLVDDCSFKVRDDGKYEMQIDFVYENEFDIRDFLLKHQKID